MQNRIISPLIVLIAEQTIKGTVTVVAATDIWTSTAHGLSTGDVVLLSNSGGALPTGASATTKYFVKVIDADTFYLYTNSGLTTLLNVTTNGTGTNSFNLQSRVMNVADYQNIQLEIDTSNSANFTLLVQGSNEEVCPDFSAAQSTSNVWKLIQIKNLSTGSSVNGATGIAPTGTDINTSYGFNVDGLRWICLQFSAWTAGKVRAAARGYGNI